MARAKALSWEGGRVLTFAVAVAPSDAVLPSIGSTFALTFPKQPRALSRSGTGTGTGTGATLGMGAAAGLACPQATAYAIGAALLVCTCSGRSSRGRTRVNGKSNSCCVVRAAAPDSDSPAPVPLPESTSAPASGPTPAPESLAAVARRRRPRWRRPRRDLLRLLKKKIRGTQPWLPPLKERVLQECKTGKHHFLAKTEMKPLAPKKNGMFEVFQVPLRETFADPTQKCRLRLYEVGEADEACDKPTKVIMVLGATGQGKTTTLNAMFNQMVGVDFEDNFRFQLIYEEDHGKHIGDMTKSQTMWVTAYKIHWRPGFTCDYSIVLIDTPGFRDSGGIVRDQAISTQLAAFFSNEQLWNHLGAGLDCVAFVGNAGLERLTHPQKYVIDSVLALFGKDIGENVVVLATFADAGKVLLKHALSQYEVPFSKLLKLNNSALFANNGNTASLRHDEGDEEEGSASFNKFFWDMGTASFQAFFKVLKDLPCRDLAMTRQVIQEREQVELAVASIQQDVRRGLNQMEIIRQEIKVVKSHEADIQTGKKFKYTVNECKIEKVGLPAGVHTTTCLQCNRTCHCNCVFANDADKALCVAMNGNGYCKVCPGNCHWSKHSNLPYKFVESVEVVEKTDADLKKKYEDASGKFVSAKDMVEKQVDEFYDTEAEVFKNTLLVRKGLQRLDEIALRKDPKSHLDYIDLLLESEKQEASPGWKERVQQLGVVRDQAVQMQAIKSKDYNPFENDLEQSFRTLVEGSGKQMMEELKQFVKSCAKKLGVPDDLLTDL